MAVMASSAKWLLLLLLQLSIMTSSHAERAARRRSSALNSGSSCHVTQSGTGCRYALSLLPLSGGASCGQRRHGNATSSATPADSDVITDKLDDAVVKVTRMMKQLSVRCLRHLRQIKADLRKVRRHSNSSHYAANRVFGCKTVDNTPFTDSLAYRLVHFLAGGSIAGSRSRLCFSDVSLYACVCLSLSVCVSVCLSAQKPYQKQIRN